jgi:serine/threonine protein kinase
MVVLSCDANLHGIDVGSLVSNGKSLMLADMSEIVRQAAVGLYAAHEQIIIHRDVQPSNLMLTCSGKDSGFRCGE